jgi:hypothetical protein
LNGDKETEGQKKKNGIFPVRPLAEKELSSEKDRKYSECLLKEYIFENKTHKQPCKLL